MVRYLVQGSWDTASGPGHQRLLYFFLGLVVTFLLIRISVRLVRAKVRWWPGNITPGGTHIHHVVFGVVAMMLGGVVQLAAPDEADEPKLWAAALFGVGAALVLDEFALILHLRDVYWSTQGRLSVDAVFLAVGLVGLLLLGARPLSYGLLGMGGIGEGLGTLIALVDLGFAVIALLKGKIWTGLLGLLLPPLAEVGALRLARPNSPWARWRYRQGSRKLDRALRREARFRQPLILAKIRFQEFISGRHDLPEPERVLSEKS
ncbi:hypothetical protein GCM10010174_12680 [Kutzneria viridogrisea]|uniref:Integral membrane protein n=2 Tax=Kutzneria TaxID=43356 RepID=W5WJW6_9PSEU|nr:hypothetical protein [Kutzneria albida]AHI01128.1 hypothetical protein KALB_7770 [Kutzneria albida DSM 43870]MBA8926383.1 hypothetical protein [Kutzneria viridogrisea]